MEETYNNSFKNNHLLLTEKDSEAGNLYKFKYDETDYNSDISTDLDSDDLSYDEDVNEEVDPERVKQKLRLEMNLLLAKTKKFYHTFYFFNDVKKLKFGSITALAVTDKELVDEFVNSGLETFNCDLFNSATDLSSRYKVESLSESHSDYKTVSNAVQHPMTTHCDYKTPSNGKFPFHKIPFTQTKKYKLSKVLRVLSNRNDAPKRSSGNKLLYHGTQCYSIVNILNRGLVPSKSGSFGQGVYLTNGINRALVFSSNRNIKSFYVFVVEVLSSDQLVIRSNSRYGPNDSDGCNFTKFEQSIPAAVEQLLYDSKNCSICKGLNLTGKVNEINWLSNFCDEGDIFVTRQNFAVPAYLLKFDIIAD